MSAALKIDAEFPEKLGFLFKPARYKVAWGGRGGAKSWGFARALLILGIQRRLRILCARETQKSVAESVHQLLSDQIVALGFERHYSVRQATIVGSNGSEFLFAGIKQNVHNMKSFEGCDICWVEEAAGVRKASWNVLIPTIRKEGSEIWATFNPELETDDTYQRFIVDPPADAVVVEINWRDNPWFPATLERERQALAAKDEADYSHVYEGTCKQTVEGAIYRNELLAVDREKRVTRVPYDSQRPVHTFWDLGYGDNTSIWFAQSAPFEFHVIDHLSGTGQALKFYIKELKERPYIYGTHWLPHDAKAHELGSGRTIEEQLKAHFESVRIAKKLSVDDGIAAVRAIFGRCFFDREHCSDGLQSLRHYRYEADEQLSSPGRTTFKRQPLHDWASHDADAFRTLGVSIKEAARPRKEEDEERATSHSSMPQTDGAWMA